MVRESGILWDHKTDILVFEEEKKNSPPISYICTAVTKYLEEDLKGRCYLAWFVA